MKLLHIDALINEIQKACKDIIISCHRCFLAPQNFTEEASLSHNHTRLVVLNLQAIVFKLSSLCSFAEFRPVAKQFYWVRDCINRLRSSLISEWVEFWEFRCPLAANVLPLFDRKARMLLTFDETCFFLFEVSWVSMTSFSLIRIISYGVVCIWWIITALAEWVNGSIKLSLNTERLDPIFSIFIAVVFSYTI